MDDATLLKPVVESGKESSSAAKCNRDFLGTFSMDDEEEDVSLLRQPMRTALTGFLEAKKAFENGTDEVRRLLIHECSLIYECNVCRNMFRSLANFITHKRIYCKVSFEGNNYRSYSDNSSLIIQTTEHHTNPWLNKSRSTGSSPVPRKTTTRDLSKIIERLKRVDVSNDKNTNSEEVQRPKLQEETQQATFSATTEANNAVSQFEQIQNEKELSFPIFIPNSQSNVVESSEPVLQLESVPTSTQAVYQTLNPMHAADSMRLEVDEVHNLLISNQQNTMIGPDGKAIAGNHKSLLFNSDNLSDESPTLSALLRESQGSLGETVQQHTCDLCHMQFQTEKTLSIHIQKKHTSSTYVFQCPTCSLTFLQPAAVIRHLANEHKKPLKRIRKMRETILKKRIQVGDVHVKGPSRELKRLQMDVTKESIENSHGCQTTRHDSNGSGKPLSKCSHCQGTFEKRAAFVTHLAHCRAKNKSSTKDQGTGVVKAASTASTALPTADTIDEIQTKLQNQNLVDNQYNQIHAPHAKEIKNIDQTLMDGQASMMMMMTAAATATASVAANQSNHELNIKSIDFDFLSQNLSKVNIKQEPQEEEFNSTSTQATTGSDINEMFENLERQTFGEGLQTVSLDLMVASEEEKQQELKSLISLTPPNEKDEEIQDELPQSIIVNKEKIEIDFKKEIPENDIQNPVELPPIAEQPLKPLNSEKVPENKNKKQKGFRTVPASKQLTCRCKICNKQFNALSNLRRHISMFHYRARRFGCNLCDYRAFRRYDIVNHLTFVHKMQGERESMAVEFVTMHEIPYSKDDVEHDIVVVQETAENIKVQENGLKTYENKAKRKHHPEGVAEKIESHETTPTKFDDGSASDSTLPKVVRKRLRKSINQEDNGGGGGAGQRRPIRNRIKPVNNDFVYDLSALKEEPKDTLTRLSLKRRNTMGMDSGIKNSTIELTPPIKITPYRLRTEPLIPANRDNVRGSAAKTYRNAVHEALAAPSTLPEIPAERPQMRPRLSTALRSDSSSTPVIEATELEVARLESTFFDDSFLEKFAKKSNPSFKMKPLFSLQHSPLNSILQKFENNTQKTLSNASEMTSPPKMSQNGIDTLCESERVAANTHNPPAPTLPHPSLDALEESHSEAPSHATTTADLINHHTAAINSLSAEIMEQFETTPPNGKHRTETVSPPSTPRKRITLMQRLAENRAKRRDTVLSSGLEN